MVQSGMKTPFHSAYSGNSGNTLFGVSYSATPGTPAGYYIAAVISEWSKGHCRAPVTPNLITGVIHVSTFEPRREAAHGRVGAMRARATGVPPYPETPRHSQWMGSVTPTFYRKEKSHDPT